jgi:hypothetical protein
MLTAFEMRIQHGVDDVDPHAVIDFDDEAGRMAAFANLSVTQS